MKVKIARLFKLDGTNLVKAFVDIIIEDVLLIKGLRVVEGSKGLFVSMPREKNKDNRWYETICPLTKEVKDNITETILKCYNKEEGGKNGIA